MIITRALFILLTLLATSCADVRITREIDPDVLTSQSCHHDVNVFQAISAVETPERLFTQVAGFDKPLREALEKRGFPSSTIVSRPMTPRQEEYPGVSIYENQPFGKLGDFILRLQADFDSPVITVVNLTRKRAIPTDTNPAEFLWDVVSTLTGHIIPYYDGEKSEILIFETEPSTGTLRLIRKAHQRTRTWVWLPFLFSSNAHRFSESRDSALIQSADYIANAICADQNQLQTTP